MAKIILIAAIGKNNELGKNNNLIWHLKEDLIFFKDNTINHKIVMGYNTFKSLPKLLIDREHIVLTHKNINIDEVQIYHEFEDLKKYLNTLDEDVYIIGGESIYKLFINIADELLLTEIDLEDEKADAYFPEFDKDKYIKEIISEHVDNNIKYKHVVYRKIYEKGKLIVIEGTDCSGKETQSKLLVERLKKDGEKVATISFPMYDTPTGKIVGACLLGKPHMCKELLQEGHSFFPEGGGNVDSLTALSYYAADRRYNLPIINKYLNDGYTLIIDRYVTSNMAHRGGMIKDDNERKKMYKKIDLLEYEIMELPKPDKTILLYMPYEYACILKKNREELPDEAENNEEYLHLGEKAYLELAKLYNYDIVNCVSNNKIKTIDEIHEEVYKLIKRK